LRDDTRRRRESPDDPTISGRYWQKIDWDNSCSPQYSLGFLS
jgi:hypothetical protein